LETDPTQWPSLTRKAVEEQGQSYKVAIENALRAGRITKETAAYELREIG
jgi:defect-in-organelle-trafficking protein DotB